MSPHKLLQTLALISLAGVSLLQGCKSSGAEKVDQTSTRIEDFRASIETLKSQVHGTSDALTKLVDAGATDPKPAFASYEKQVEQVTKSTTKAKSNMTKVQSEGEKLFADWTARLETISDPEIRKASEKRRDELKQLLGGIADEAKPVLAELDAFVATAKDLETYLSQDLTPAGIQSIAGKAKGFRKSAESISDNLDDVAEAAGKAATPFATAKPPPPPAS